MNTGPDTEGRRGRNAAGAILLAAVTALAYLPALRGGFIWDDDTLVTGNPLVRSAGGLAKFWFTAQAADYWPVTMTAFWAQWRLWGMTAAGYHAVSLALHIGEALLLWGLLRRLRVPAAYLAAFLFAVHPVNVETVAWISEQKNLMAMGFMLLAILAWINFEQEDREGREETKSSGLSSRPSRPSCSKLSLLFFGLAMLSKGSVAILPLILLGTIAWRRRLALRDFVCLLPFFLVAAILAAVDVWFQRHGTAVVIRDAGPLERLLGAAAAVWFYLGKALWPAGLAFVYPQWSIHAGDLRWWLPLAAAVALTAALWRGRRTRWGRRGLFAWGFFVAALLPVMGLTDVYYMRYSLVADHYGHIALIAVTVLAAAGWAEWSGMGGPFDKLRAGALRPAQGERVALGSGRAHSTGSGRAARWAGPVVIAVLAGLTWRQCREYRDGETLYRATLERNPRAWIAHTNLGVLLAARGEYREAIGHYRSALALKPDLADAEVDLGIALAGLGRTGEGISWLQKAAGDAPQSVEAHYNLGLALVATRRYAEAAAQFEITGRLRPGYALTEFNLGGTYLSLGRPGEAAAHYEKAVAARPDLTEARDNLGTALVQVDRVPEAVAQFSAAVRLRPGDAGLRNDLACALAQEGRLAEARAQFTEALRLRPDYPEARANLARLP